MTQTDTMVNVAPIEIAQRRERPQNTAARETVFDIQNLSVSYGKTPAIKDVSFEIYHNRVTAIIGPSGCGKSTFIRCLNRMNDLGSGRQGRGRVALPRPRPLRAGGRPDRGAPPYRDGVPEAEPVPEVDLRQRRFRAARQRRARRPRRRVEQRTRAAPRSGTRSRTGSRRSRARPLGRPAAAAVHRARLAVEPEVILMDEPCSALDPIATSRIED